MERFSAFSPSRSRVSKRVRSTAGGVKVFFDNCTSPVLASVLDGFIRHLSHNAHHIKDLPCGRDATDLEWIGMLGADRGLWMVVTGDDRIRKNKAARAAFRS